MSYEISSFDWFLNREKGRPCLVAGTAPTIESFDISGFDGTVISMGDGPLRFDKQAKIDYWINANNVFPFPSKHHKQINQQKDTVFLFSDSVAYSYDYYDKHLVSTLLKIPWFAFDQKHFNAKPCVDHADNLICCQVLKVYPNRLTIQEYLQHIFKTNKHYSGGGTVATHALALSLILGCNPIYIHGIEIPRYAVNYTHVNKNSLNSNWILFQRFGINGVMRFLKNRLFNKKRLFRIIQSLLSINKEIGNERNEPSAFADNIPHILDDFAYLVDIAKKNGVKVYVLSETSTLNEIPDIKYIDPNELSYVR